MAPGGAGRAAVVGSGPNGLAAAVTLARAGVPVTVFEAAPTPGGGTRTAEVVEPGVLHDVCSAVHPMAVATEFFREFELDRRIDFAVPEASYAHPLDGGAAIAYRSLERTAAELGVDGAAYSRLYEPLLRRLEGVVDFTTGGSLLRWPRDVVAAALVGLRVLEQGTGAWNARFSGDAAPALLSGVAAHGVGKHPSLSNAAPGMLLGLLGHASGWPVPIGGSRAISDALVSDLEVHGGVVETDHPIAHLSELDEFDVVIFDTSARGLARIAGGVLPPRYLRALTRFRSGSGAAKVDFVLDGPIPWADARVAEVPTVHLGGTRAEIATAEFAVSRGRHPERPYVLLAQPAVVDEHRNQPGVNAVWSYTHVPYGSQVDVSEAVTAQIERFAPGFRDRVRSMKVTTAAELAEYNPNYHGGDFSAGATTLRQMLARPALSGEPWRTPAPGIYLCSSSTAPGPGVHGLGGWNAARLALRYEYGLDVPSLGVDS